MNVGRTVFYADRFTPDTVRAQVQGSAQAQPTLASEQTPIGEQMLVCGVAPITPRDRLAIRASAPLAPSKPKRPANHGLFDTLSRTQIEMF